MEQTTTNRTRKTQNSRQTKERAERPDRAERIERAERAGRTERQQKKSKAQISSSDRNGLVMLLKWLCVFAMGAFLYFQLNGEKVSETGFAQMQSAVTAPADLTKMQKANNQMIKRLYGIDPTSYSGVLLYYPLTNMGAEELMLVQMKDESQKETVQKALEARQAAQVKSFEGYGVEQTAMLKKSIIDVRSNYALFISGDNPGAVDAAFDGAY